jgi:antirestriction protein
MINFTEQYAPAVYVGTYGKYANGSINGNWVDLKLFDDKEDFLRQCKEIHSDEDDPEFMFQDFQDIPEPFISEGFLSDNLFPFINAVQDWSEEYLAAFEIWAENFHYDIASSTNDIEDLISDFNDQYMGDFSGVPGGPQRAFAEELFDETERPNLPERIQHLIDYDAFARDIFSDGFWERNGFVFQNP